MALFDDADDKLNETKGKMEERLDSTNLDDKAEDSMDSWRDGHRESDADQSDMAA